MSSLSLNWLKAVLPLIVVLASCSGSSDGWPRSNAIDGGGFTVRMPVASGAQNGSFVLGADTVSSHVNILADSGITYVAAWFDTPASLAGLPPQGALDSVWNMMVNRFGGIPADGPGPLQSSPGSSRGGWFVNEEDVRLGLVIHSLGDRVVVMNAATPAPYFGPREERNMLRFLNSFEPE